MNKAVKFEITDGKLIILVDPNKDGEVLMKLEVDLTEVPDEVISAFKS